ncbi:MAG TPA: hypothetical protein VF132_05410, partial [Rudaea sp.]
SAHRFLLICSFCASRCDDAGWAAFASDRFAGAARFDGADDGAALGLDCARAATSDCAAFFAVAFFGVGVLVTFFAGALAFFAGVCLAADFFFASFFAAAFFAAFAPALFLSDDRCAPLAFVLPRFEVAIVCPLRWPEDGGSL